MRTATGDWLKASATVRFADSLACWAEAECILAGM